MTEEKKETFGNFDLAKALGDFRKRIYQGQIPPLRGVRGLGGVWNYWHEHKPPLYPPILLN